MHPHTPDRAAALLEDLTFLADTGAGLEEAARRTGYASPNALDVWLRRHDQRANSSDDSWRTTPYSNYRPKSVA